VDLPRCLSCSPHEFVTYSDKFAGLKTIPHATEVFPWVFGITIKDATPIHLLAPLPDLDTNQVSRKTQAGREWFAWTISERVESQPLAIR
jgi:hypothetical protein